MTMYLVQKVVKYRYEVTVEADDIVKAQELAMEHGDDFGWLAYEPVETWRIEKLEPWVDFPEIASLEATGA
jgi:hypothetical protein